MRLKLVWEAWTQPYVPTFPVDKPAKTIDYIYVSTVDLAGVKSFKVPAVDHSDHLPVISAVVLNVKKQKKKKNNY